MPRLNDYLTGWGTILGTALTAISMLVIVTVYVVHTADGVTHCNQRLDRIEPRLEKMGDNVTYLRGAANRPRPIESRKRRPAETRSRRNPRTR